MIQAVLVLENGRKIDVRSVADIDPGRGEGGGGGGGEDFPVGRFFSVRLDDPDVEDRWRSRVVPRDDLASLVACMCVTMQPARLHVESREESQDKKPV